MSMGSPSSWLFSSDSSRYSTRARLLFMALSFAIGILTFLLYLALWYLCSRRRRRRQRLAGVAALASPGAAAGGEGHGMSADAIAALPTFVVAGDDCDGGAAAAEKLDCPVCLGHVEPGETARRLPKCGHSFHAECVDAWLRAHSTCPMCRAAVGTAAAATARKTAAAAADQTEAALPPV